MRNAEDVTFGGSGLNRAAASRATTKAKASEGDSIIFVWRGKILMDLENQPSLFYPLTPGPLKSFLSTHYDFSYQFLNLQKNV